MSGIDETKIIHFLSGQASEDEAEKILQWKNESPENKRIFKEIEMTYHSTEIILNPERYNSTASYKKISSQLVHKNVLKFGFNYRRVIGYAAAIVITASLTWFAGTIIRQDQSLSPIVYHTIETPKGGKSQITLEDGTKIWLNASSKLAYPNRFEQGQRIVKLEGEGFFEVAKDKKHPFKVETSGLSIQVLGTTFNVKSYPEEGKIETTLIEGEIILNKMIGNNSEQNMLTLKPNQKATFIKKEGILFSDEVYAANIPIAETNKRIKEKLVIAEDVNLDLVVSWKEGRMVFKNETLESIAVKLGRRFDVKFNFIDQEVKQYRFSGTFDEISIDQALKALQFASAFNFEINQDNITIKK